MVSWGYRGLWQSCWCPEHPMSRGTWDRALWKGSKAPCSCSGVGDWRQFKEEDPEGTEPWGAQQQGLGKVWLRLGTVPIGSGPHGRAEGQGGFGPGCERPCTPILQGKVKRPLPTQTVPLWCGARRARPRGLRWHAAQVCGSHKRVYFHTAAYWSHSLRCGCDGTRLF